MLSFRRLWLLAALVTLSASSIAASATQQSAQKNDMVGVVLGTKSCAFQLGGVPISTAHVYGHKDDLIKLLDNAWRDKTSFFWIGSAACLMGGNVGECVLEQAPKVDTGGFGNIPPGNIIIIVDNAGEFADSYKATLNSTSTVIPSPQNAGSSQGSNCFTSELCINSKGESSYSLKCQGYGFKVSTSGEVKVTVKGVPVPVVKGN